MTCFPFAPSRNNHPKPRAFSLLEVLLAVAITGTVLAAMLVSTTNYVRYYQQGIDGNREAQIVYGVVEDLRADLRACVPSLPGTFEAGSQLPASDSSEGAVNERTLQWNDSLPKIPIHFVGRNNALLLLRSGTSQRFHSQQFDTSQQVAWLAPGVSNVRLPAATFGTSVEERVFGRAGAGSDLLRTEVPVDADAVASSQDRLAVQQSFSTPEVTSVEFRYFDGQAWQAEWDSHRRLGRLPLAVEAVFRFDWAAERDFRIVVRLPAADASSALGGLEG